MPRPKPDLDYILQNFEPVPLIQPALSEKELIATTLEKNNWNISQTARDLNVGRSYLYRRIAAYEIWRKPSLDFVPCIFGCGYPAAWQHYHPGGRTRLSAGQTRRYLSWLVREARAGDHRAIVLVSGGSEECVNTQLSTKPY